MCEWFEKWFGATYLEVYPHRNDAEAQTQVDFLLSCTPSTAAGPVLDIACGSGRHLQALHARSLAAFGIDLSPTLLHEAQKRVQISGHVVRADMRTLPFKNESFTLALSMFTSFGYFKNRDDNLTLLGECRRVLKPMGIFVLDYLNTQHTIANLIPKSHRETDALVIDEQRSTIGSEWIEKIITITSKQTGEVKQYKESVALFSQAQLAEFLKVSGFRITNIFGDFDGRAFDDSAPRCIVLSESTR